MIRPRTVGEFLDAIASPLLDVDVPPYTQDHVQRALDEWTGTDNQTYHDMMRPESPLTDDFLRTIRETIRAQTRYSPVSEDMAQVLGITDYQRHLAEEASKEADGLEVLELLDDLIHQNAIA